jgi:hypothetical protein
MPVSDQEQQPGMTERQFMEVLRRATAEVADRYYPKGDGTEPSAGGRRGEFLRDAGVMCVLMTAELQAAGFIVE